MTIEEVFSDLYDKYGEDFNWYMLPLTQADGMFVTELKNEIGEDHFLYDKRIWAVAKCESNDDVLYVTDNGRNGLCHFLKIGEFDLSGIGLALLCFYTVL